MKSNRLISSLLISVLAGLPLVSLALDTDVYLSAKGVSKDDSPNVLIILDNSGSMLTPVTTRPAYDPTHDYSTDAGSPGIPVGRIYWSTSGNAPSATSRNWFLDTKNNCEKSKAALASGGTGSYAADQIVGARPSGTKVYWESLSSTSSQTTDARVSAVDCKGDNGSTDPKGYVRGGTTASGYTNNAAQEITWGSFTTPTLYNTNYMNYINNSSLVVTDTRMNIAKNAVKGIIDANQNVRLGLMIFNYNAATPHGGRLVMKIDTMDAARRTAMKAVVDSINAETNTPLAETMWEAYSYLSGRKVDYGKGYDVANDWGATPAPDRDKTAENASGNYLSPFTQSCQKTYIIYVTDGDPTSDTNADSSTRIAGLAGIAAKNSGSCSTCTPSYTDSSYLDELAGWMHNNDVYAGQTGSQTVVTFTIGFGSGISAAGHKLLEDTAKKGTGWISGTQTGYYTADSADQLVTALQNAIIEALKTTTSFAAPALSVNAFNTMFNRDEVYFAVFKPSTAVQWDGNLKKYKLCNGTQTSPACVFGEVIDRNGNPAVDITTGRIKDNAESYWGATADGNVVTLGGAGEQTPDPTTRKIYTYTGAYGSEGRLPSPSSSADLSLATNLVSNSNASLTAAMLNAVDATDRSKIIYWMLGYDTSDTRFDTAGFNPVGATPAVAYRWRVADPMHSRPVAITYGGNVTTPIIKLFVGTNDGMVRMINENNGKEEWSFIPQELLGIQRDLSINGQGNHIFGLDGSPTFDISDKSVIGGVVVDRADGVIDPAIGDYVHMFIGMRRGGRNIYALDVTPGSKLTNATSVGGITPKLLWVIQGGTSTGYTALGQTWSKPALTKISYGTGTGSGANAESTTKSVLIFGGGYNTTADEQLIAPAAANGNAIFIIDPATGERIWWASSSTSGANLALTGMDYPIPSDLALLDANGDGATDRIYVGDIAGQLWRIDLSPTLRSNSNAATANAGSSGYILADVGCASGSRPTCTGTAVQNRRKFYYPPNVAKVYDSTFSTQAKHDLVTIVSGDREDPLDNITTLMTPTQEPVHNRIYVFRDYITDALSTGSTITYPATIKDTSTPTDLYDATNNDLQDATLAEITASGIQSRKGWFIDLKETTGTTWVGEKGLAKTIIFGGSLYVSTYVPANASTASLTCQASEGLGKLYVLNLLSGAARFDLDTNSTITTTDRSINVGGGIPPELVIVIREGGVSGLVNTDNPNKEGCSGNTCAISPKNKVLRDFWFN